MPAPESRIVRVIEVIKTNLSVGLMYIPLLRNPEFRSVVTAHRVVVKENAQLVIVRPGSSYQEVEGERFYYVDLIPSEANPTPGDVELAFSELAKEFGKMLVRNVTLDTYEQLFDYCESTGQLDGLQAQDWYLFARLVRHALTHDQHWRFSPRDLARLPVTWRDRTIKADMDGEDILMEFYGWFETIELLEDMLTFARTLD